MNRLLTLAALTAFFLRAAIPATATEAIGAVELEFEYSPAFREATLVWMVRQSDGVIHCSIHTRPEGTGEESKPKWKKVKEVRVSTEDFSRIEAAFETPEVRRSAERGWPPFPDATGWRLRKAVGARSIEIRASSPDSDPAGLPIVRLARSFFAAAGAPTLPK